MRVLMTGMDWFPDVLDGGLNRYFYEEVQALSSVGIEGTALVSSAKPGPPTAFSVRGMGEADASLVHRLGRVRRLALEAFAQGVDLVNSHFALYAFPWVRALPGDVPLVVNFQGPWADEIALEAPGPRGRVRAALARCVERAVYRRAARIITLSQAFADIVQRQYRVPVEKVRVVPGAFDPAPYLRAPDRQTARQRLGWPQDRPILVAVRRLARRMGLEGLIEAIAEVRRARPDVLLLIGGKGSLAAELDRLIRAHGLSENVRLLGFVQDRDLPLAYAAADLTVVPTLALEGFGLCTVEALASGTPVVGTPVGGTPEILASLDPTLIFEGVTPTAMAHRLISSLAHPEKLPDRQACRAHAERFGWSAVMPRIRDIYTDAIKGVRG